MQKLKNIEMEVRLIREAINDLVTKGEKNAALVVYISGKCNDILKLIHTLETGQNGVKGEVREVDTKPNSGTTEPD